MGRDETCNVVMGGYTRMAAIDKGQASSNNPAMTIGPERKPSDVALSPASKVLLLRGVPLLQGLAAEQLLAVGEISEQTAFDVGDLVFGEGDVGDQLYLITSGEAEVFNQSRRLAVLRERDCFGEMALLDGGNRSASVRALTSLSCLAIGRDDFGDLLEVSPSLAKSVMRVLIQRLRTAGPGS